MTRREELRAERIREQNNMDPYGLGLSVPVGFSEKDLFDDEESKEIVIKEVKTEVKTEVKAEVTAEVLQAVEQQFSKMKAELEEQKQMNTSESVGNLEINDSDTLQSLNNFEDIEVDYEMEKIKKVVKEVLPTTQQVPVYPPYPYALPYQISEADRIRYEEEQKKKAEEEEKKRFEEEERVKRENSFAYKCKKRYRKFLIRIKNNLLFKGLVELFITVFILFVLVDGGFTIYCFITEKPSNVIEVISCFVTAFKMLMQYLFDLGSWVFSNTKK